MCFLCYRVCLWVDAFDDEESGEDICGTCYEKWWKEKEASDDIANGRTTVHKDMDALFTHLDEIEEETS